MECQTIPVELWDWVFSHLRPTLFDENITDTNDPWRDLYCCRARRKIIRQEHLLRISLLSKSFHSLALPQLFHTVILGNNIDRLHLLTALIQQPALGHYVKALESREERTDKDHKHLVTATYEAFIAAQPNVILQSKLRSYLRRGLKRGRHEAILALIIAYCPRLKQIDMLLSHPRRFPWKVLQEGTQGRRAPEQSKLQLLSTGHLSRLEKLRITALEPDTYNHRDDMVLDIPLALPNLTTLVCSMLLSRCQLQLRGIPKEMELRHLSLLEPKMSTDALLNLLHQTPQLRFLQLRVPDYFNFIISPSMTLSEIGNALRLYGEHDSGVNLEVLVIHSESFEVPYRHPVLGQIGSLRPLNLKRLSIPLDYLLGPIPMLARRPAFGDIAASASHLPPLTINGALPDTLECIDIQWDWENLPFVMDYFHRQIIDMISSGARVNLRRVLLQARTHGPALLSYTKDIGEKCWTVTTYDERLELGTTEALDGNPMIDEGILMIVHKESPAGQRIW